MRDEVEEYLRMADEYYRKGMELFSGRDYPDAAEKVWASIKTATMALTDRCLGRTATLEGEYWRDFVALAFIRAGISKEEADERAEYFVDARAKLHGECFYGLFYEEREHKPLIDASKDYLDDIRKLLKQSK